MRLNVLISNLLVFGIVLLSWCPGNAMALPDPGNIILIITSQPKCIPTCIKDTTQIMQTPQTPQTPQIPQIPQITQTMTTTKAPIIIPGRPTKITDIYLKR